MSQIDYASLDAEDYEATASATVERTESPQQQPILTSTAKPKRRAPLSDEQRLVAAQKSVESLRAKVVANRDRMRLELIEDLYRKYSIGEFKGDPSEHQRLASLRAKLAL